MSILKTSRKVDRRVTFLGRLQNVNLEPLVQMHFHCIILNFISWNVCLKHQRVSCLIVLGFKKNVLQTSYKGPKATSSGWRSPDVPSTSILNKSTKRIYVVIFSVLVQQMCAINTKSQLLHILSVLEKRPMNVLKTSQSDTCSVTSLGCAEDVNLNIFHKTGF